MAEVSFRYWAIATALAYQQGLNPWEAALNFAFQRGVSLPPEKRARLRFIVDTQIVPILKNQRMWTGPKRESTDDPEGVSASKRQKREDEDDQQQQQSNNVVSESSTFTLEDLPDEIIDAIAIQLGTVFDMGSLRTVSTRFTPIVDYRRVPLKKALQRPYSGEAYVDYSDQDNIARLLMQTKTDYGSAASVTWLLLWVSPVDKNQLLTQTAALTVNFYSLDQWFASLISAYYKTTRPPNQRYTSPINLSPVCHAALQTGALTAKQLLGIYISMQKLVNPDYDVTTSFFYDILSKLAAFATESSPSSSGISRDAKLILNQITSLISLWMIFYELRAVKNCLPAFTMDQIKIDSLKRALSDEKSRKIGKPAIKIVVGWMDEVLNRIAPGYATRSENDEYKKAKSRISAQDKQLRYLLFLIAKLYDEIEEGMSTVLDQMLIWCSHCAAKTQEQIDQCHSDPIIKSLMAWDTEEDGDIHIKAMLLAARSYVICTGKQLNFDTPKTELEKMLHNLKNQADENVDIEEWDYYDPDSTDMEQQRKNFQMCSVYRFGTTIRRFFSTLNA